MPKFFSDLIGDLRDEVWRLKGEGTVARLEDQIAMVARTKDQIARDMMLLSLQDELMNKNAEIAGLKGKYHNVVFVMVLFVLGLAAGEMLMM